MDETTNVETKPIVYSNHNREEKPVAIKSVTEDQKPYAVNEPMSAFSNESYANDRQYAIVLAQLMEKQHREKAYKWIEK